MKVKGWAVCRSRWWPRKPPDAAAALQVPHTGSQRQTTCVQGGGIRTLTNGPRAAGLVTGYVCSHRDCGPGIPVRGQGCAAGQVACVAGWALSAGEPAPLSHQLPGRRATLKPQKAHLECHLQEREIQSRPFRWKDLA